MKRFLFTITMFLLATQFSAAQEDGATIAKNADRALALRTYGTS